MKLLHLSPLVMCVSLFADPLPKEGPAPAFASMQAFFAGEWSGSGEFSSGAKAEADVSFTPDLDGHWLVYRHADRKPGPYKAMGTWGLSEDTRGLVMVLCDNFGGFRIFSSKGWLDGQIEFERHSLTVPAGGAIPGRPEYWERFTFVRQGEDVFKMTYEVSKDAVNWRLGDFLVFRRHETHPSCADEQRRVTFSQFESVSLGLE